MPPLLSASSMDSWDFAATVNSPTTSVYRRGVLEEFVREEDIRLNSEGVFDMDYPKSSDSASHHLSHVADLESEDVEVGREAETTDDIPTSSSPSSASASHSSLPSSDAAPSQESSPENTSAASSYTSPSDFAQRLSVADAAGQKEPQSPTNEKTLVGLRSVLPPALPSSKSSTTPHKRQGTGSDNTSKLWSRLKSNVKPRSSNPNEETPKKEKVSMTGILSSASKNLLSKAPSRGLASTTCESFGLRKKG
jgi:serine/threonine-protein kinase OSR1/STK39